MKLGELKKLIADLDDDLEVITAPVEEMPYMGKVGTKSEDYEAGEGFIKMPNPEKHFKVIQVDRMGVRTTPGNFEQCVVFGFDIEELLKAKSDKDPLNADLIE